MKIVLASTFVPFVGGGGRFIVEWLEEKLREAGHQVERFYLPFIEDPEHLLTQTAMLRLMDLSDAGDRLICFRPPSHVLRHPNKVLWFIHHIRAYYDLWDSPYAPPHTPELTALRGALHTLDTDCISEAKAVFTNSQVVADRLKAFNGIDATPLYPPIFRPERFRCEGYGDEIVVICRMEAHKRQLLLLEAMRHVKTPVRLRLCGRTSGEGYAEEIAQGLSDGALVGRVAVEDRWITEGEKAALLAHALATAYAPQDEDSYGYPSLEAAHADKAVITTTDSGGVLELVEDGINGFICPPEPRAIAERFDQLWRDRDLAKRLGQANQDRLAELRIDWPHVVEALTR